MSNPKVIELTEVEQNWLDEFNDVMYKMPKALTLTINSLGDGQVEVFPQQVKISPLLNLGGLKELSQFWRHSQIRQSFGLYRTLMDSMWEKDTPLNFTVPVTADMALLPPTAITIVTFTSLLSLSNIESFLVQIDKSMIM
ncbi:hypothetical protein [Vibrio cholerae]|uniref:hypothetical protein n=1 Tax=Vibrio cholerae TaxID=666 RepID=UPI000E64DA35|nr:hypothetical protein [Vibrio cholerae]